MYSDKCKKCDITLNIKNLSEKGLCKNCYNEYHRKYRNENREKIRKYGREWMACRRWLDGGPDNFLLGPDITYNAKSINGVLHI